MQTIPPAAVDTAATFEKEKVWLYLQKSKPVCRLVENVRKKNTRAHTQKSHERRRKTGPTCYAKTKVFFSSATQHLHPYGGFKLEFKAAKVSCSLPNDSERE